MRLTNGAIIAAIEAGEIVVDPLDRSLISVNSVDVRLGPQMWRLRDEIPGPRDLYGGQEIAADWEPMVPISAAEYRAGYRMSWARPGVPDDALVFVLTGGQFYLGQTLERIGTRSVRRDRALVPDMRAKSTTGRHGLTVALCAGSGDVGYVSQWALEIRPVGTRPVPLVIGTVIGQVVFDEATPTDVVYDGPDRYQNGTETRYLPKPLIWKANG